MSDTIGRCKFVDGTTRAVYRDADGRQFVIDDDCREVRGVWILLNEALDDALLIIHGIIPNE